MNKIGTFQLAVMFCGCFLGAGFLSGNELWQFFGAFGINGLIGCALSVFAIGVFCAFIIYVAAAKKTENPETVLLPTRFHKSSIVFGILQAVLVFAVVVIMISGSGTLVSNLTGLNRHIFGVLFGVALAVLVVLGTDSIVRAFSVMVPIVVAASVIISIALVAKNGWSFSIPELSGSGNPLLNNWALSAISYLSYSIFSSVGVFAAVSGKMKNKNTLWYGALLGAVVMAAVAFAIIGAVYAVPDAMSAELPMLSSAMHLGTVFGAVYAILLLLGMFGAALSCMMALTNYFKVKFALNIKAHKLAVITTAVLAFIGSIFGFGDLVGTVYPIFGYIGIVVLLLLTVNFIKLKKNQKNY